MTLTQLRHKIAKIERAIDNPETDFYEVPSLQCELDALLVDLNLAEKSELNSLRCYASESSSVATNWLIQSASISSS